MYKGMMMLKVVLVMVLVVMMTTQAHFNTTPHIHGSGPGHLPAVVFAPLRRPAEPLLIPVKEMRGGLI